MNPAFSSVSDSDQHSSVSPESDLQPTAQDSSRNETASNSVAPPASVLNGTWCPACGRTGLECRVKGNLVACPHARIGSHTETLERRGLTYRVYLLPPEPIRQFITALFEPHDLLLLRPIETWTGWDTKAEKAKKCSRVIHYATTHRRAMRITESATLWNLDADTAETERANQFFGVCPRFHGKSSGHSWDNGFQIRTVRFLWADLDHCTVEQALSRCRIAGLPHPTATVSSGHGAHLYWRLAESYFIDDAGNPPGLQFENVTGSDGQPIRHEDGRIKQRSFYFDRELDTKVYAPFPLTPKATHVERVVAEIAKRLDGDHTTDLARLLRLPCTFNRKDERNSQTPTPCALVECEPTRRYPLAAFETLLSEASFKCAINQPKANVARTTMTPRPANTAPHTGTCGLQVGSSDQDDDTLIAEMRSARNGQRFAALFDAGDLSSHGNDHHRGDSALCDMLAFWTGPDPDRIDRLFRRSALYRDKWDRPDYREATLRKVLSRRTEYRGQSVMGKFPPTSLEDLRALMEGLI